METIQANRATLLYMIVVTLIVAFVFYHMLSVQIVASPGFSAEANPYICPIASFH